MNSLIELCHPPREYIPSDSTEHLHRDSPEFKIQQLLSEFLEKAVPVCFPAADLTIDVYGLVPSEVS
jgi:hypothetical protein